MVVVLFKIETRPEVDSLEYKATSRRMHELVEAMPGYICAEDFTGEDGGELSMVRFESLEALEAWRDLPEHVETQKRARQDWYEAYHVEVLTTVREYSFKRGEGRVNLYPPRA
jgi:heme-degrading monooxygenase HmoA